jgi:hypothetical protein
MNPKLVITDQDKKVIENILLILCDYFNLKKSFINELPVMKFLLIYLCAFYSGFSAYKITALGNTLGVPMNYSVRNYSKERIKNLCSIYPEFKQQVDEIGILIKNHLNEKN